MAKYDTQLAGLKDKLASAQNILIVLPTTLNTDKLAVGLSLYLSLQQIQKQVSIVSDGSPLVGHGNLFGVGEIKNQIPSSNSGDLTVVLEGVVADDGTVPTLEKLDWFPDGSDLNLVFHTLPGQKFEPKSITPKYQDGSFDLIFCLGSLSLTDLGTIYNLNPQIFSDGMVVNIDNAQGNQSYGQINVLDYNAGSISEMMLEIMIGLGLPVDGDVASNVLLGIYDTSANLSKKVTPETFTKVAYLMQSGGRLPTETLSGALDVSQQNQSTYPPLNQVFGVPAQQGQSNLTQQGGVIPGQVSNSPTTPLNNPLQNQTEGQFSQTQEEKPSLEQAVSNSPEVENPAPDWLTPKVFKGGSLG